MSKPSSEERTSSTDGAIRARRRSVLRALGAASAAAGLVAFAAHGCGGGSSVTDPGVNYPALVAATADEVVVPGYAAMAASMAALESEAGAFCAAPTAGGLEALRAAWRDAIGAWLEVAWLDFGPVEDDNRRLRIEFWPDANGNVRRSVDQVLARSEPVTEEVLAGQSVAAQGLPALELLLFDPSSGTLDAFVAPEGGPRRCAFAVAIAANLSTIADSIRDAWRRDGGGFVDQLALAGQGSTVFASPSAAVEELVNAVVAAIEQTKNERLGTPLGAGGGSARPDAAESHLSGNSLANVAHSVAGIRRALGGAGVDIDAYLRQIGRTELADRIAAQLDETEARARAVPVAFSEALVDPAYGGELTGLFDTATLLTRTLKNDLSFALGVTIGFNSNDGD